MRDVTWKHCWECCLLLGDGDGERGDDGEGDEGTGPWDGGRGTWTEGLGKKLDGGRMWAARRLRRKLPLRSVA